MGLRFGKEFVQLKLQCSCLLHKSQCSRPTPTEHLCTPLNSSFHYRLFLQSHLQVHLPSSKLISEFFFNSCTVHFDTSNLLLLQPMQNNFALKH